MESAKQESTFVIGDVRTTVVLDLSKFKGQPAYVSFTGTMEGGGQIVDRLREKAEAIGAEDVVSLCDIWDSLHLKSEPDLTQEQRAELAEAGALLAKIDGGRFGGTEDFEDLDSVDFDEMADVFDSRQVIERIESLRGAFASAGLDHKALPEDAPEHVADAAEELKALEALEEQAEPYASDWRYGETLIRDSYFEDYAEQFAEDIGAVNSDAKWPNNHIDWEAAARELQQDYTAVEFKGITYWLR